MADKTTIKALAIKVRTGFEPPGTAFKWEKVPQMEEFTKNIAIPEIASDKEEGASKLGSIVSGMPTVFARANLFRNALDLITDKNADVSGLLKFYKGLVSEWRGFIGCVALNYESLNIERVYLRYSDGKGIGETSNIYEPTGAFGNVLFDRKTLWCEQGGGTNAEKSPFIDVISYKGQVVGGTSPDCFLFTSVDYKITDKMSFVHHKSGKFADPLQDELQPEQLRALFAYVKHVTKNIERFRGQFDDLEIGLRPDYQNIIGNLQDWQKEMEAYATKRGWPKLVAQAPPEITRFDAPFSVLFNHSTQLFGAEGTLSSNRDAVERGMPFDPKRMLLAEGSEIAQFDFGREGASKDFLDNRPVLLLRAEVKDMPKEFAYFALPIAPLGLNVFGKNLSALMGMDPNTDVKSRLTAVYDPTDQEWGDKLTVSMKLITREGDEIPIKVEYKVGRATKGQDILLWPNFISKQWGRYFLFSEMPHNDIGYQASPLIGDTDDEYFRIIVDEQGDPVLLAKDGRAADLSNKAGGVQAVLHIAYNNAVADNSYKYEIYESNRPFRGVRFSNRGKEAGYMVIRYDDMFTHKEMPRNYLKVPKQLVDAHLGVDFGSTNTSVAYYVPTAPDRIKGEMRFKNRRISLLASDSKDNNERPAVEDEIFFFQNDEISMNAIKSMLTVHDARRMVKDRETDAPEGMFVRGGFPCFEKNLPVETATENMLKLSYPERVKSADIIFDMKWSRAHDDHKKAYLGTLLLHVYAHLFDEGYQPVKLKWSFPSSMDDTRVGTYSGLWSSLPEVNPLVGGEPLVVSAAPVRSQGVESPANHFGMDPGQPSAQAGGWGAQPAQAAGWGALGDGAAPSMKEVALRSGPMRFDFHPLDGDKALTEACAVANYLANNQRLNLDSNYLTLCFDVGGSTTDISALVKMPSGVLTMVKQNSIRFAAQRVAHAARYASSFKDVLLAVCERKQVSIQGLNVAPYRYSPQTAAYYFEQLVDRLEEKDMAPFYQLIRAKCPELMCVNLYVTGLIMYYAGQLASKLRTEVSNSLEGQMLKTFNPHMAGDWKPMVNIVFAGKGARLFDWFRAVDEVASNKYYTDLFIKGFGGRQQAVDNLYPGGWGGLGQEPPVRINPTSEGGSSDIKYEVSKGLAYSAEQLHVPRSADAIEILGEDGFVLMQGGQMKPVPYDASITPEMLEHIGSAFLSSPAPGQPPCPKFMDFAATYYDVARNFGLKMTEEDFRAGFMSMNINAYIKGHQDYRIAKEAKKFDFVTPIIIMEGMKFLEDDLLKGIQKK